MTDVYVLSGYWGAGYVSEDAAFADETPLELSRNLTLPRTGSATPALIERRVGDETPNVIPPSPS